MKYLIIISLILCCLPLGGCLSTLNDNTRDAAFIINLPTPEGADVQKPVILDRDGAHAVIRISEEKTKQKLLDTKKAEFEAKKASAPQIVIDTKDEMTAYQTLETVRILGDAVTALTGKSDTYGVEITTTAAPKDVWAERIEATGRAVMDIGNTPAAIVTGTGWAVGMVAADGFAAAGDKYTAGGDLKVQGSHNRQAVSVDGTRNGVSAGGSPSGSAHDDRSENDDHSIRGESDTE